MLRLLLVPMLPTTTTKPAKAKTTGAQRTSCNRRRAKCYKPRASRIRKYRGSSDCDERVRTFTFIRWMGGQWRSVSLAKDSLAERPNKRVVIPHEHMDDEHERTCAGIGLVLSSAQSEWTHNTVYKQLGSPRFSVD